MKGIIINSFPKSGTHLLTCLLEQLDFEEEKTHLSRSLIMYGPKNFVRNAIIYKRIQKNPSLGLNIDLEARDRKVKKKWLRQHINQYLQSKCYVQAHLPYSHSLKKAIESTGVKMLYIHRDPRDTLVSLKNYLMNFTKHPNHIKLKSMKNDECRFKLLLNGFNDGSNITLIAPFCEKYFRSIPWSKSNSICSVSFENIIGQKGKGNDRAQRLEIAKILDFLNIHKSKLKEIQNQIFNTQSVTFNKGTIGQWKEEFSENTLNLFEKYYSWAQKKFESHV